MSERCFECLDEFAPDARRFAVLKRMRDMPPEADEWDRRHLDGLNFDEVEICADCAGWYGDHPIEIPR